MMKARKGFSLIETMVAMTMFSVVMLGMAQMAASIAVRGRTNELVAKRNAVLQLEANKFGAVPFSSLATWVTSDRDLTQNNFKYRRKLAITASSNTRYRIKIVVIPYINPTTLDATKKDSVYVDRSLPPSSSPLCAGC